MKGTLEERLAARVAIDFETGCWNYDGARVLNQGYGAIAALVDGKWKMRRAHRVMWEMHVGEIPAGLELDHLCRNKGCVNPDHLEPVTRAENTRRWWAARRGLTDACESRTMP